MPMFDLFGLGKDIRDTPESGASYSDADTQAAPRNPRRFWSRLLLIDGILIAGFGSALIMRIQRLSQPQARPQPATRPQSLKHKKVAEPIAAKNPAPAAPEKTASPRPNPAPAPMLKGPIGSPSVNAPELPQHGTPALEGGKSAAAKPAAAAHGEASGMAASRAPAIGASQVKVSSKPGSRVKAVDFIYTDASAQKVFLLGPFLVHGHGRKEMDKNSDGTWQATIYLNSGTSYRYRFEVIDTRGKKSVTPKISLALDAF